MAHRQRFFAAVGVVVFGVWAVPHLGNAGLAYVAHDIIDEIDAEIGIPVGLDVDQLLNVGAVRRSDGRDRVGEPGGGIRLRCKACMGNYTIPSRLARYWRYSLWNRSNGMPGCLVMETKPRIGRAVQRFTHFLFIGFTHLGREIVVGDDGNRIEAQTAHGVRQRAQGVDEPGADGIVERFADRVSTLRLALIEAADAFANAGIGAFGRP